MIIPTMEVRLAVALAVSHNMGGSSPDAYTNAVNL